MTVLLLFPFMESNDFCWQRNQMFGPVDLGACHLYLPEQEYDTIVYMDSDMLVVGDIAALLDFLPPDEQPPSQ